VDGFTTTTVDATRGDVSAHDVAEIGIIEKFCAAVVGFITLGAGRVSCIGRIIVGAGGSIIITAVAGGTIAKRCAAAVGIG